MSTKDKFITLRVSEETKNALDEIAKRQNVTLTDLIMNALAHNDAIKFEIMNAQFRQAGKNKERISFQ
ncbi:MAG: hypothetical protein H6566_29945 [Lewinellaceae bacterium]|nr:hypothetical protein [Lewinellaceae bacterium]